MDYGGKFTNFYMNRSMFIVKNYRNHR